MNKTPYRYQYVVSRIGDNPPQYRGSTDHSALTRDGARFALKDAIRDHGLSEPGSYVVATLGHDDLGFTSVCFTSVHVFNVERAPMPLKVVD